jgi:hypothetical protein
MNSANEEKGSGDGSGEEEQSVTVQEEAQGIDTISTSPTQPVPEEISPEEIALVEEIAEDVVPSMEVGQVEETLKTDVIEPISPENMEIESKEENEPKLEENETAEEETLPVKNQTPSFDQKPPSSPLPDEEKPSSPSAEKGPRTEVVPDIKELTIKNLDTGEQYVIGENDPDFEFDTFPLTGDVGDGTIAGLPMDSPPLHSLSDCPLRSISCSRNSKLV